MSVDWNNDESVIVPQVDAIAVYENSAGGITICQKDPLGAEDAIIALPKYFVPALIEALQKSISK